MILALKTDGPVTEMWLYEEPKTHSPRHLVWESGRTLSDSLLEQLAKFLQTSDHTFQDLTGIIIYSGPGSFTSLRIGHATVNALADSLDIPVIGTQGETWLEAGLTAIPGTPTGRPALPHYGSEAHITKPKS